MYTFSTELNLYRVPFPQKVNSKLSPNFRIIVPVDLFHRQRSLFLRPLLHPYQLHALSINEGIELGMSLKCQYTARLKESLVCTLLAFSQQNPSRRKGIRWDDNMIRMNELNFEIGSFLKI